MPPLRNSKIVHTYERREGKRIVADSEYFGRYGKKREGIIRHVLEAGGADEAELRDRFGSQKARLRDFRRTWIKPLLEDRVLVADGGTVTPAPDWREALERVRERTDEEADNRRQAEKYRRQSIAYRARLAGEARGDVPEPEPAPDLMGKEKAKEVFAAAAERDAEAVEADRRAALVPAVAFVKQMFDGLAVARLGMLEDAWRAEGGLRWLLLRALKETGCAAKRHAEHPGEWFVYPPAKWPGAEVVEDVADSEVVPIRPEETAEELFDVFRNTPNPRSTVPEDDAPRKMPPKVNGVFVHNGECACWLCEDDPVAVPVRVGASA